MVNRRVPPDFPFRAGLALPPGTHEQLFLADRRPELYGDWLQPGEAEK